MVIILLAVILVVMLIVARLTVLKDNHPNADLLIRVYNMF